MYPGMDVCFLETLKSFPIVLLKYPSKQLLVSSSVLNPKILLYVFEIVPRIA